MIVDKEGLEAGRFAIVDFNSDGTVKDSSLLRLFNMYYFANDLFLYRRADIQQIRDRPNGHRY